MSAVFNTFWPKEPLIGIQSDQRSNMSQCLIHPGNYK